MFSLVVSGSRGSRRGPAEWLKLPGMVVSRFHFLADSRDFRSWPCGPLYRLPDCHQVMAADFPAQ